MSQGLISLGLLKAHTWPERELSKAESQEAESPEAESQEDQTDLPETSEDQTVAQSNSGSEGYYSFPSFDSFEDPDAADKPCGAQKV